MNITYESLYMSDIYKSINATTNIIRYYNYHTSENPNLRGIIPKETAHDHKTGAAKII